MEKSAAYLLVTFVAAMVYSLPASADYCEEAYNTCVNMRCGGLPQVRQPMRIPMPWRKNRLLGKVRHGRTAFRHGHAFK